MLIFMLKKTVEELYRSDSDFVTVHEVYKSSPYCNTKFCAKFVSSFDDNVLLQAALQNKIDYLEDDIGWSHGN